MLAPTTPVLRQSPLHQAHLRGGGRMVEFGGWNMPVQYRGILEEHHAVRKNAGLFDISHMGEFLVGGPGAAQWLNSLLTNDLDKLVDGRGQYTLMLNDRGGVIDDLLVYRLSSESYFLVVNASKIDEDAAWMRSHLQVGIAFEDASARYAAVALQGPLSGQVFTAFTSASAPARNEIRDYEVRGVTIRVAQTGYTGESGVEIFFPPEQAESIWEGLLSAGVPFGLKAAGLGARDTLRLEAGLPLNGQDLGSDRSPLEAGLGAFVSLTKDANFPGKQVLLDQKQHGVPTRLVALKFTGKGAPPRPHYQVLEGGAVVGELCSGTWSPTLNQGIAFAYLPSELAQTGRQVEVDIRGQRIAAEIVPKPFYKRL